MRSDFSLNIRKARTRPGEMGRFYYRHQQDGNAAAVGGISHLAC